MEDLDKSRRASGYFEAKIQLRPYDEEVINFIFNHVENTKSWVVKVVELKTGVDIYLSSWRVGMAIGKKLKAKYRKSKLLVTRSLYSVHKFTSKNLYRVTILFRLER